MKIEGNKEKNMCEYTIGQRNLAPLSDWKNSDLPTLFLGHVSGNNKIIFRPNSYGRRQTCARAGIIRPDPFTFPPGLFKQFKFYVRWFFGVARPGIDKSFSYFSRTNIQLN